MACELDDFMKFQADGTLVVDQGPTKCDLAAPQTATQTWRFARNETELVYDNFGRVLVTLTATTLTLRVNLALPDGSTAYRDYTYTAF
jgi:hypothetical protein